MSEDNGLILLVTLGTTITVLLSGTLIFFVVFYQRRMLQKKLEAQQTEAEHQKRLLQANITSQETERKRIASELHDGVGAMLSAAKLNLGMLKHLPPDELEGVIAESKDILDDSIETVRRISKDLLPASLEKFGLVNAIKELCHRLSTGKLHVTFDQEANSEPKLKKEHELAVFRIVQEAINNAIKYAETNKIEVSIFTDKVIVKDNGKGFDIDTVKRNSATGVGLYNMENRANSIGGKIVFDSDTKNGTTVTLKF